MTTAHEDPGPALRWASVISVWAVTLVATVVVGVAAAPAQYFTWLPLVLAASLLLTFAIQLALQSKVGLVLRVSASLAGAVLILAIATAILAPIALATA